MSYLDMAKDAGYSGDEARQVAAALEQSAYEEFMTAQAAEALDTDPNDLSALGVEDRERLARAECAAQNHPFHGTDSDGDRCYCGTVTDFAF